MTPKDIMAKAAKKSNGETPERNVRYVGQWHTPEDFGRFVTACAKDGLLVEEEMSMLSHNERPQQVWFTIEKKKATTK